MSTSRRRTPSKTKAAKRSVTSNETRLDALVAEATVDAHDESEQAGGFFAVLEDELALPFETTLLGTSVTVEAIELRDDDRIAVRCVRGRSRQWIALEDLPLPSPAPAGAQWIEAYRRWIERR